MEIMPGRNFTQIYNPVKQEFSQVLQINFMLKDRQYTLLFL